MPDHNRKLPDDTKLARDMAQGMTLVQIAQRYKCGQDHVRRRLKVIESNRVADSMVTASDCGIQRIVIDKKVTAAEFGGTIIQQISLPRISMHVAAMNEAGR